MPVDIAIHARILARATEVLGGAAQAQDWMTRPAMGLNRQRPVDLLETIQGAEIVDEFLTRLEYGVYS